MKIKKTKAPEMSSKRSATTDLNHDNWDKEEEPEEKGVFKVASSEELQNRVIKKAKRRVTGDAAGNGEPKGIFSGFTGFTSTSSTSAGTTVSVGSAGSPFSFLSKISPKSTLSTEEKPDNQVSKVEESEKAPSTFHFEKSNTYYGKLKGLNQAVSSWIKKHVDENPLCILSPIFQDYEKHLKEIEQDKPQTGTAGNQFSFGISTSSNGSDKVTATESKKSKESNTLKLVGATGNKPLLTEASKPTTSSTQLFSFLKTDAGTSSSTTGVTFSLGGQKTEASTVTSTSAASFSFGQKGKTAPEAGSSSSNLFSFAPATTTTSSTAGFSFSGSGKPFTFGAAVTKPESNTEASKDQEEEEDDQPPKVEFKAVVEEDNVYSKKCKVFVKQGAAYGDRGIGTLYLKPVKDSEKTQLLVRADTNLGNILLNLILNESIPTQRMGKNNVMMVCIPTPESEQKPTPILLRVKTGEEADELLETINKYKK